MFHRIAGLTRSSSFFLFGPRGTGKSTLLRDRFKKEKACFIDLLDPDPDWRFSYLRTKDDAEIDLIVDRPGRPLALIEIKSTDHVKEEDTAALRRFKKDMPGSEAFCFSLDPKPRVIDGILCVPWQAGLKRLGLRQILTSKLAHISDTISE